WNSRWGRAGFRPGLTTAVREKCPDAGQVSNVKHAGQSCLETVGGFRVFVVPEFEDESTPLQVLPRSFDRLASPFGGVVPANDPDQGATRIRLGRRRQQPDACGVSVPRAAVVAQEVRLVETLRAEVVDHLVDAPLKALPLRTRPDRARGEHGRRE